MKQLIRSRIFEPLDDPRWAEAEECPLDPPPKRTGEHASRCQICGTRYAINVSTGNNSELRCGYCVRHYFSVQTDITKALKDE